MKNFEKFKTAEARASAYSKYCSSQKCEDCPINKLNKPYPLDCCMAFWLELEYEEEKPLPCPFCGSKELSLHRSINNFWYVECNVCTAKSAQNVTKETAIVTYNVVSKAVMEGKKEVK